MWDLCVFPLSLGRRAGSQDPAELQMSLCFFSHIFASVHLIMSLRPEPFIGLYSHLACPPVRRLKVSPGSCGSAPGAPQMVSKTKDGAVSGIQVVCGPGCCRVEHVQKLGLPSMSVAVKQVPVELWSCSCILAQLWCKRLMHC